MRIAYHRNSQIIYGNSTIPPPTLLGTTAFSAKGVHAAAMSSSGDMFMTGQGGGAWARDGATGAGQYLGWGMRHGGHRLLQLHDCTRLMDDRVTRMGAVGVVPDAAGAAPTLTAVSAVYGGSTCYIFLFEVGMMGSWTIQSNAEVRSGNTHTSENTHVCRI